MKITDEVMDLMECKIEAIIINTNYVESIVMSGEADGNEAAILHAFVFHSLAGKMMVMEAMGMFEKGASDEHLSCSGI